MAEGLTSIMDLASGPDGKRYVVELDEASRFVVAMIVVGRDGRLWIVQNTGTFGRAAQVHPLESYPHVAIPGPTPCRIVYGGGTGFAPAFLPGSR